MTDNTPEIEETHTAANSESPSPGQQLKTARERAGLSRAELSSRLCLIGNKLEMLEEDRYERLPSSLYVRGYIRNACKELGIDDKPVLEAYAKRSGEDEPEAEAPELVSHISRGQTLGERRGGFNWLLLLPLLLVGGVFWWVQGREAAPPAILADSEEFGSAPQQVQQPDEMQGKVGQEALLEPAQPDTEDKLDPAPADPADVAQALEEEVAEPEVAPNALSGSGAPSRSTAVTEELASWGGERTEAPQPATPQDSSPEPSVPAAATEPAAEAPAGELQLSFEQEAWVEVKDATGRVLLAKLRPAGSEDVLTGQPPFSVMLGNAAGTQVRYRGELIDSDPIGSRRTRRLTVGD